MLIECGMRYVFLRSEEIKEEKKYYFVVIIGICNEINYGNKSILISDCKREK